MSSKLSENEQEGRDMKLKFKCCSGFHLGSLDILYTHMSKSELNEILFREYGITKLEEKRYSNFFYNKNKLELSRDMEYLSKLYDEINYDSHQEWLGTPEPEFDFI